MRFFLLWCSNIIAFLVKFLTHEFSRPHLMTPLLISHYRSAVAWSVLHSISKYLESRRNELAAGWASWTLPAVKPYFNCTGFSRALYISLTTILLIYPLFSFNEQRPTLMDSCDLIGIQIIYKCLAKHLPTIDRKFLLVQLIVEFNLGSLRCCILVYLMVGNVFGGE